MAIRWLIIFLVIISFSSCQRKGHTLTVGYQDAGGLKIGDKVILDGFSVGEVRGFHFVPKIVFADLSIKEGFKIPVNSQFIIHQSFLGATSILVKPSNRAEFIAPIDTIVGVSFKAPVLDSVKQRKLHASINKIAEGFVELIQASSSDSIK